MNTTTEFHLEIWEIIETPRAQLEMPYLQADFFELFHRLDRLEEHIQYLLSADYESEDSRNTDLQKARKARDTIKRETHPEEMRVRACGWRAIPLGQQQQQLILDRILDEMDGSTAVPRMPGKRGIKSKIRAELQRKHPNIFRSDSSFDEAWKMLRKKGVIEDA